MEVAILNALNWLTQHTLVPLAQYFFNVSSGLFDWVLSPEFSQIPLTHGIVVDGGWIILRDVANMLFILAFLIMAIATMLGVEKYSWRKLLPNFIIAALLVNFTKLIAGVVVDFSNLVMLFFIDNGLQNATAGQNQSIGEFLANAMGLAKLFSSNQFLEDMFGLSASSASANSFVAIILQFVFLFSAAITLLLLGITLITRVIRIWMLVIFSPLVAVAGILNPSVWSKWFGDLSKWAIIGINIVFFVFLAALLTQAIFTQGDLGAYIAAVTAPQNSQGADLSFLKNSSFIGQGAPILIFFLVVGLLLKARGLAHEAAGHVGGMAESFITQRSAAIGKTGISLVGKAAKPAKEKIVRDAANSRFGRGVHSMALRAESMGGPLGALGSVVTRGFEKQQENASKRIDVEDKRLDGQQNEPAAINAARAMLNSGDKEKRVIGALLLSKKKELKTGEYDLASSDLKQYGKDKEISSRIAHRLGLPTAPLRPGATADEIDSLTTILQDFGSKLSKEVKGMKDLHPEELKNPFMIAMLRDRVNEVFKTGDEKLIGAATEGIQALAKFQLTHPANTGDQNGSSREAIIQALRFNTAGVSGQDNFNKLVDKLNQRVINPFHPGIAGSRSGTGASTPPPTAPTP